MQSDEIHQVIEAYEHVVMGSDERARNPDTDRAYGGIIRPGKGELTESITKTTCLSCVVSLAPG